MIKHLLKYLIAFIIAIIFFIAFIGTNHVQSVDDLAYVVALGIDVGEHNNLKITFQFTMPNSSGENNSGETAPSIVNSVEASSIDAAINLMNTYVSKEINLSHCKIVVFSEELAQKGIGKEIYTFTNKVQMRPDVNVVVSKCSAQDYIKSVSPSLENLVAKYYEISARSGEYTGYSVNAELGDFFTKLTCQTCQPIAMLGGVNTPNPKISEEDGDISSSSSSNSGGSKKEDESSSSENLFEANGGTENIGLAVFKGDKLVGELTAIETLCHLIVTNDLKSCNISIPNPGYNDENIDLFLTLDSSPKIKVELPGNTPFITVKVKASARISSINKMSSNMTESRVAEIEESANNYLQAQISKYLYKTAKEFNSDINGFGKYALPNFQTQNEFLEYHWLDNYYNSFFKVDVHVDVKSGFLLTGT